MYLLRFSVSFHLLQFSVFFESASLREEPLPSKDELAEGKDLLLPHCHICYTEDLERASNKETRKTSFVIASSTSTALFIVFA